MTRLTEIGESARNAVLEQVGRGVSRVQERTPLRHDVLETDDEFLVVFDAPGAAREDVQVRFVENTVEVRIDRFRDFYEAFEMRFPGRGLSLRGEAELPEDVLLRPAGSSPTLTGRGELHVRVPKDERGRSVAVQDEAESIELDPEPSPAGGPTDDEEAGAGGDTSVESDADFDERGGDDALDEDDVAPNGDDATRNGDDDESPRS
ncbi:Hsp20/alpha crystallin family protein [Halobium palmae]|uniref:Hsp20/alpha crystallin family protein n=1 Tax=Halobium palmae TaxID=1776492 RepID=A0ABD5RYP2_9EURY